MFTDTRNIKFLDEVVTVNTEAEKLKQQGIKIIIVLSHCGIKVDRVMAARCPNVDLIVGGHSHTFLYSGDIQFLSPNEASTLTCANNCFLRAFYMLN